MSHLRAVVFIAITLLAVIASADFYIGWDTEDLNVLVRFEVAFNRIYNKTTILTAPKGKNTSIGGYDLDVRNKMYIVGRYDIWGNARLWMIDVIKGTFRSNVIRDAIYWIAAGRNLNSYASIGSDVFDLNGPTFSYVINGTKLVAARKCVLPLLGTDSKSLAYHQGYFAIFQLLPAEYGYSLRSWSIMNCSTTTGITVDPNALLGQILSFDYDAASNRLVVLSISSDKTTPALVLTTLDPVKGAAPVKRVAFNTTQELHANWCPSLRSYLVQSKNRYVLDAVNVDTGVVRNIFTTPPTDPQPPWDVDFMPLGDVAELP